MTDKLNIGMMIGGPRDGEVVQWDGDYYKVAEEEDYPLTFTPGDHAVATDPVKIHTFRFVNASRTSPGRYKKWGFWVPAEERWDDVAYVMDELVKSYAKAARSRRR